MLQGYVAARIMRWATHILYRSLALPPPALGSAPELLATGRVRGTGLTSMSTVRSRWHPPALIRRVVRLTRRERMAAAPSGSSEVTGRARTAVASAAAASAASAVSALSAPVTSAATRTAAAGISASGRSNRMLVGASSRRSGKLNPPLARRPKKVLILISDTGGGHRASAEALAQVLALRHGDAVETSIVDVWTEFGPWPWRNMVPYYRELAKRPQLWWAHFKATSSTPTAYFMSQLMSAVASRGFEACMREHVPDVVVSMHPLCQAVPIKVLRTMYRRELESAAAVHKRAVPRVPFVTVVTDLATPHPFWLHPRADLCFVPSAAFERAAVLRGLAHSQLRQHGLPVRQGFEPRTRLAPASEENASRAAYRCPEPCLAEQLGLRADQQMILVVGGGDGVGKLGAIVEAMAAQLARHNERGGPPAQMAVICGKNRELCATLRAREWGAHLHVVVEGFTSRMSDYMGAASCIVTKAGPGTIAEACCCGLPILLSGFLPGQESGNVGFVVDGGFGAYSPDPLEIANTVTSWLEDPQKLAEMSERSRRASRPGATELIADDILGLIRTDFRPARSDASSSRTVQSNVKRMAPARSRAYKLTDL